MWRVKGRTRISDEHLVSTLISRDVSCGTPILLDQYQSINSFLMSLPLSKKQGHNTVHTSMCQSPQIMQTIAGENQSILKLT